MQYPIYKRKESIVECKEIVGIESREYSAKKDIKDKEYIEIRIPIGFIKENGEKINFDFDMFTSEKNKQILQEIRKRGGLQGDDFEEMLALFE